MRCPLLQYPAKGEESQGDEFNVLFGEGDAYDGDGEDDGRQEMGQGDPPAKKQQPDDVEEDAQGAVGVFAFDDFLAEGSERSNTDLDRLDAERNADNGHAEQEPAENIAHGGHQPAEDQPDDIAECGHADWFFLPQQGVL